MQHWSRLATRNWQANKVRALGAVLAVALGTAAVVWVSCCHESVRQTVWEWAGGYVGNAHITVESMLGKYEQMPERLVREIRHTENVKVVTPRLLLRRSCRPMPRQQLGGLAPDALRWSADDPDFDLEGIDQETEPLMRSHRIVAGRMLSADDGRACLMEARFARENGLTVGDFLLVWDPLATQPIGFEIVGLFERRYLARFQKPLALVPLPVLQEATGLTALISAIDVMLADAERTKVRQTAGLIHAKARRIAANARIRTAEARMKQIEAAQSNQRLVLVMLGCVAMLTALFIILSTLSMGLLARVQQLGLLRCVGMTRRQLAQLMLVEVVPLGVVGILVGIPVGLALTALTVWLVPGYVGAFVVSRQGIALASAAGLATTLVAALLPALGAWRVSPLEAARPRAHRARDALLVPVALAACGALLCQRFGLVERIVRDVNFIPLAAAAVVLLYLGYALVAPVAARLIGTPAVWAAAACLRVRARLLQDQVGYAAWRSAGICCGLMVGLSLIVGIIVVNASVTQGWQFPSQFPAAYVWSFDQLTPDTAQRVAQVPGVGTYTVANAVDLVVEERRALTGGLLHSFAWFLAVDVDSFFDLVRLEFLDDEGDEKTARQLLKEGGHVLIADDFSRSRNKHVGDQVKVWDDQAARWRYFKVAGVVRSPALDIAAGYFQLQTEYNVAAAGSVLGTRDDLKRLFGIDGANLVLLNFDLPPLPVPPGWPPAREPATGRRLPAECYDDGVPLEQRWRRWREAQVLRDISHRLSAPQVFSGTVAELKDEIDNELTRVTRLLTAIPGVALLVAAIGVANLMTANVTARARQLAILRAVGATRGLVLRLVVGEALVLGLLGSALGLALGVHLASDITKLVDRMWGFSVDLALPWDYVGITALLTVGLCIVAGAFPARHAARTNIVDALHVP